MLRPHLQKAFPLSIASLMQHQCDSLGIEQLLHFPLRKFCHIPSPSWQFPAEPSGSCLSLRHEPTTHKSQFFR